MKNHIYNTINKNLKELKKQIIDLLEDQKINNDVKKVYKIKLEKYSEFQTEKYKDSEFNELLKENLLKRKTKRKKNK